MEAVIGTPEYMASEFVSVYAHAQVVTRILDGRAIPLNSCLKAIRRRVTYQRQSLAFVDSYINRDRIVLVRMYRYYPIESVLAHESLHIVLNQMGLERASTAMDNERVKTLLDGFAWEVVA